MTPSPKPWISKSWSDQSNELRVLLSSYVHMLSPANHLAHLIIKPNRTWSNITVRLTQSIVKYIWVKSNSPKPLDNRTFHSQSPWLVNDKWSVHLGFRMEVHINGPFHLSIVYGFLPPPMFLPSTVSSVWRVPGMGAHCWVAGICQPWGQYSFKGLAGHNGSPWVSQPPTIHLSEVVG